MNSSCWSVFGWLVFPSTILSMSQHCISSECEEQYCNQLTFPSLTLEETLFSSVLCYPFSTPSFPGCDQRACSVCSEQPAAQQTETGLACLVQECAWMNLDSQHLTLPLGQKYPGLSWEGSVLRVHRWRKQSSQIRMKHTQSSVPSQWVPLYLRWVWRQRAWWEGDWGESRVQHQTGVFVLFQPLADLPPLSPWATPSAPIAAPPLWNTTIERR